ncbi:MAG: carboxypeptidase-like regulatory domain-containing protein, partial [Candidatus Acidiferrales bacterium]
PSAVPLCDVLQSPDRFDKQTIQLRGNVHLAFENFSLTSEACPNKFPSIWLAFGGDVGTPTMSTVNDNVRVPGGTPTFGGIAVSLVKDDNFDRFFALISARRGRDPFYHVTATLTGTFLAGNRKLQSTGRSPMPGYGHLGCCFLFVISRVDAVDADPPPQLNVSGAVNDAQGKPVSGVDVYSQTVNCCQPKLGRTSSDDNGYFAIKNAGQVLTFLKPGYRPQSLVLETGRKDLRLTMESTSAYDWQIPACKGVRDEHEFHGLPLRMSIPEGLHSEQISKTPESSFIIHRKPGYLFIRLSRGNSAAPFGAEAKWIFDSTEFTQRNLLDTKGTSVGTDTKGVEKNKMFWRILAMPGQEIVEYSVDSREAAALFDGIIDSACFSPH